MRALLPLVSLLALATTAACDGDSVFGPPTESTCPQGSTLTYAGFGKDFMDHYCIQCHSSEKTGAERHGAPLDHDFDTVFGVRNVMEHVDETTAAGPAAINRGMPETLDDTDPVPTDAERYQLGEWLACGAP